MREQLGGVLDLRINSLAEFLFGLDEIETCLEIHPKLRTVVKVTTQSKRGLGCDRPLAVKYRRNSP